VREVPAETPPRQSYCRVSCNNMIINEVVVEAAGVELIATLITRDLLILGTATKAKKAPLPDPLYVYCTKMLCAPEGNRRHHMAASIA
jgi:hypothetical protein